MALKRGLGYARYYGPTAFLTRVIQPWLWVPRLFRSESTRLSERGDPIQSLSSGGFDLSRRLDILDARVTTVSEALDILLWRLREAEDYDAAAQDRTGNRSDSTLRLLNELEARILESVKETGDRLSSEIAEIERRISEGVESSRQESRGHAFMLLDNAALMRAQLYGSGLPGPLNLKAQALKGAFDDFVSNEDSDAIVVEVGSMRYPYESPLEGGSTLHLARWCAQHKRKFISIDIDENNVRNSRHMLQAAGLEATLIVGDGASVIAGLQARIGLLFLDGSTDPDQALSQYAAAEPRLSPGAIIAIDDVQPIDDFGQGKGTRLLPKLESSGWRVDVVKTEPGYLMALLRRDFA